MTTQIMCYLERAVCLCDVYGSCGWQMHTCEHENTPKCEETRGHTVSSPLSRSLETR